MNDVSVTNERGKANAGRRTQDQSIDNQTDNCRLRLQTSRLSLISTLRGNFFYSCSQGNVQQLLAELIQRCLGVTDHVIQTVLTGKTKMLT